MIKILPDGICQIEGTKYPSIGFGTYRLTGEICFEAVNAAFETGYRIFDTATYYNNFEPIGRALGKQGRENFYLISKVWHDCHTPQLLEKDLKMTLETLQTPYLDTYFLHWPNSSVPIEDTLATLEEFRSKNLIRHIGLSNVTINHLKRALECKVPIAWIQVEMSPFFYDPELLVFCKKSGIAVQAWSPLGRGNTTNDPLLVDLGKKHQKTPSQIALKWIQQHECLPLPGSKNPIHIQENFELGGFTLSEDDMEKMNQRARSGKRYRLSIDEFDYTYEQCWPHRHGH